METDLIIKGQHCEKRGFRGAPDFFVAFSWLALRIKFIHSWKLALTVALSWDRGSLEIFAVHAVLPSA